MGVFILFFGGLFWLWKWIEYQAEEEAYKRQYLKTKDYNEKLYGEKGREEERKAEELLCSDVETRIRFIEENILDDITELYGENWREIFSNIERDEYSRQISTEGEPLGVAKIFYLSSKGIEANHSHNFMYTRYLKRTFGDINLVRMYKIYERNIQKFYPEIHLLWIPEGRYDVILKKMIYKDDLFDGSFKWNFAAPRPCRKWHPKIKTLDELLSELTAVDTELKT